MTTPSTPLYREITLTQGKVALVSARRFEELNAHKWHALWCKGTRSFYAVRNVNLGKGKFRSFHMHRVILGLEYGDKRQGDHKNHDTLDNRDENLRIATSSQNQCNRGCTSSNISGFKGVHWHKRDKKWQANITFHGKQIFLGYHENQESAHAAYRAAALRIHGSFARSSNDSSE